MGCSLLLTCLVVWQDGGGVYISSGTVTLNSCNIHNNQASSSDGGGIAVYGGTATLTGCDIHDNQAKYGGGVYVRYISGSSTSVTFQSCQIYSNSATVSVRLPTLPYFIHRPDGVLVFTDVPYAAPLCVCRQYADATEHATVPSLKTVDD